MRNNLTLLSNGQLPSWSNLFDHFFDDVVSGELKDRTQELPTRSKLSETQDGYLLSIDMPGVGKENINMEVKEDVWTLSAERQSRFADENEKSSSYMKYQRSFRVPGNVDIDQVEAHLEHGVLEIFMPKTAKPKGRKIEVEAKPEGFFKKFLGSKSEETSV